MTAVRTMHGLAQSVVLGAALLAAVPLLPFLGTAQAQMVADRTLVAQAADPATAQRALLVNLVQLRGRLITGRELYLFAGDRKLAARHLGPNLNGRMAKIEEVLGKPGAKPLQDAVDSLDAVAKSGGDFAAFEAAYAKAMEASFKAEHAITDNRLASPEFVLAAIADAVEHSAEDYDAAIKDGKVAVPKEYEEVYGYNLAAVRLWQRLGLKASPALQQDLALLERAVPSPVPLTRLYVTPEAMAKLAARIRAQVTRS